MKLKLRVVFNMANVKMFKLLGVMLAVMLIVWGISPIIRHQPLTNDVIATAIILILIAIAYLIIMFNPSWTKAVFFYVQEVPMNLLLTFFEPFGGDTVTTSALTLPMRLHETRTFTVDFVTLPYPKNGSSGQPSIPLMRPFPSKNASIISLRFRISSASGLNDSLVGLMR